MFLTVNEVQKNDDGIYVSRTTSIIAEDVVKYREWKKTPEHHGIEGSMTKVSMRRDDGFIYFHIIAEEVSHFENRVNKVLWLNKNNSVSSAATSPSASSSHEQHDSSSVTSAPSEESTNLTSQ